MTVKMHRDFQISAIRLFLQQYKSILEFYKKQEHCDQKTIEQLNKLHNIISDNVERILYWGDNRNLNKMHQIIFERYGIIDIDKLCARRRYRQEPPFPTEFTYESFIALYTQENGRSMQELWKHKFIVGLYKQKLFLINNENQTVQKIQKNDNNTSNYEALLNLLNKNYQTSFVTIADIDTCRLISSVNQLPDFCMDNRKESLLKVLRDLRVAQNELLLDISKSLDFSQATIRDGIAESFLFLLLAGVILSLALFFLKIISMYLMLTIVGGMVGLIGSILFCAVALMVFKGISVHLNNCAKLANDIMIPDINQQEYSLLSGTSKIESKPSNK